MPPKDYPGDSQVTGGRWVRQMQAVCIFKDNNMNMHISYFDIIAWLIFIFVLTCTMNYGQSFSGEIVNLTHKYDS